MFLSRRLIVELFVPCLHWRGHYLFIFASIFCCCKFKWNFVHVPIRSLTAHNHSQTHRTRHKISVCAENHLTNIWSQIAGQTKSNTAVHSQNSNGHRNGGPQTDKLIADGAKNSFKLSQKKYPQNEIYVKSLARSTLFCFYLFFSNNNRSYPVCTYLPRAFARATAKQDRIVFTKHKNAVGIPKNFTINWWGSYAPLVYSFLTDRKRCKDPSDSARLQHDIRSNGLMIAQGSFENATRFTRASQTTNKNEQKQMYLSNFGPWRMAYYNTRDSTHWTMRLGRGYYDSQRDDSINMTELVLKSTIWEKPPPYAWWQTKRAIVYGAGHYVDCVFGSLRRHTHGACTITIAKPSQASQCAFASVAAVSPRPDGVCIIYLFARAFACTTGRLMFAYTQREERPVRARAAYNMISLGCHFLAWVDIIYNTLHVRAYGYGYDGGDDNGPSHFVPDSPDAHTYTLVYWQQGYVFNPIVCWGSGTHRSI